MYHIIVNPASRSGKGLKIWEKQIEPKLKEKRISYHVYFSQKAGDIAVLANEITSDLVHEKITLIVLGGDGTVNEALQGMVFSPNIYLGYIPTGSSNDLARDLNIPKNPVKALENILTHQEVIPMDIGLVTFAHGKRYFAVSCGIGFDAAVCEEVSKSKMKLFFNKIGLGKLTYLGIALKILLQAKNNACEFNLENHTRFFYPSILFSVSMIHRYEGGGFKFCPTANYQDGLLDICTVGDIPKLIILLALPTAFLGKHYLFPKIYHCRGKKIELKTAHPMFFHTDGEVCSFTDHIIVECKKEQIALIR